MRYCIAVMFLALSTVAGAEIWKVEPGTGVGPFKLGLPLQRMPNILTPDDAMIGYNSLARFREGIDLQFADKLLVQIMVHSLHFNSRTGPCDLVLPGNLKLGMGQSQLTAALGMGFEARALPVAKTQAPQMYYAYRRQGIGCRTEGGKIVEFSIWARH